MDGRLADPSQYAPQYLLPFATGQLQPGCAHFGVCFSDIAISPPSASGHQHTAYRTQKQSQCAIENRFRQTEALNLRRQVEYEQKASAVSLLMTGAFGCVSRWPRHTLLVAGFGALVGASWPERKKRRPKKDSGPPQDQKIEGACANLICLLEQPDDTPRYRAEASAGRVL
jgi:hypothetical protein